MYFITRGGGIKILSCWLLLIRSDDMPLYSCLCLHQMLTDFQNSLTARLCSKYV